jgi:peptide/nickel transport system substrate-binding protein
MAIFRKTEKNEAHPYIPELKDGLLKGKVTRREFLRQATLLGMSAAAAYSFAGVMSPSRALAAAPRRGGTWKCAMKLLRIDHPARLNWTEGANFVRQVSDYLTETGPDNITRPALLEKWSASEDLKTWDLYLRQGVKFNNGDLFTAEDVIFTMGEWFNKDVGSSMLGLLSYLGGTQNVEKVNDYHIRLHLQTANIGVPEHLFHYPAFVLHRNFEGEFLKKPVGTGPFTLENFVAGTRAVFKRRKDHWRMGADGNPLPYIDEVMFIAMDKDAAIAALQAGQIDSMYNPRPSDYLVAKKMKNLKVHSVATAGTFVVRMTVTQPPWDDNRVRTALKMCQDREKILKLAAFGEGTIGIDAHVSPVHPEYCPKPIPKYDPQGARKLLEQYAAEKGFSLPLKVTLTTKNDAHEPAIAQGLKELARPAGFDIALDLVEPGKYWERWNQVPLGITTWAHRPLAVMVLPLAYVKGAKWNETQWHDAEFEELLSKAEQTLDVEKRRQIMCRIEDIMQERGPVGINYYYNLFDISNAKFQNVQPHPGKYLHYTRQIWLET